MPPQKRWNNLKVHERQGDRGDELLDDPVAIVDHCQAGRKVNQSLAHFRAQISVMRNRKQVQEKVHQTCRVQSYIVLLLVVAQRVTISAAKETQQQNKAKLELEEQLSTCAIAVGLMAAKEGKIPLRKAE